MTYFMFLRKFWRRVVDTKSGEKEKRKKKKGPTIVWELVVTETLSS